MLRQCAGMVGLLVLAWCRSAMRSAFRGICMGIWLWLAAWLAHSCPRALPWLLFWHFVFLFFIHTRQSFTPPRVSSSRPLVGAAHLRHASRVLRASALPFIRRGPCLPECSHRRSIWSSMAWRCVGTTAHHDALSRPSKIRDFCSWLPFRVLRIFSPCLMPLFSLLLTIIGVAGRRSACRHADPQRAPIQPGRCHWQDPQRCRH